MANPPLDLTQRVANLETDMQQIQATLQQVAQQQLTNAQTIDRLGQRVDSLGQRVDSFVFEAQRLFARLGEASERHDAGMNSLRTSVERLTRSAEDDRSESRAFRQEIRSMTDRLDALVNHLMGGSNESE